MMCFGNLNITLGKIMKIRTYLQKIMTNTSGKPVKPVNLTNGGKDFL